MVLFFKRSSTGKALLIVGLTDSGKTTMFSQIVAKRSITTFTSMKPNEGSINLSGKRKILSLVDIPGYERLFMKYWDDYKSKALGIVYVIDSLTLMAQIRHVADLLYTILSDPMIKDKKLPVLVVCNKQDEVKAKSAKVIQKQLEKELNNIRETRLSSLGSTDDGDDSRNHVLGNINKDFQFSDLKNKIEFANSCSSSKDDDIQLDEVKNWILRIS